MESFAGGANGTRCSEPPQGGLEPIGPSEGLHTYFGEAVMPTIRFCSDVKTIKLLPRFCVSIKEQPVEAMPRYITITKWEIADISKICGIFLSVQGAKAQTLQMAEIASRNQAMYVTNE